MRPREDVHSTDGRRRRLRDAARAQPRRLGGVI